MRTSFITDKEEIEAVICKCDICYIGLIDTDGSPYVIPMNFGYSDGAIILHSGPSGKHLDLAQADPRICITFSTGHKLVYQHPDVACSYSMTSKSVVCKGLISFVDDLEEKERLLNTLMHNYTKRDFRYSLPALKNVKVWRVEVVEMTCKSFGQNFKNFSDL